MAQQDIVIGVQDQGNGDTLFTAFTKVQSNFDELYSDDAGDVNQVTGADGITASPTTGNVVVSLNDDAVTYDKLAAEFTTTQPLSGTVLDFDSAQVFTKANSGTVTYTISNAEIGMTKDLILTGTGSFSITGGKLIAGDFVESTTNFVQIVAQSPSVFWYSISQEQ